MSFTINIEPADEGFISGIKKVGSFLGIGGGQPVKRDPPPSFSSINAVIDNYMTNPRKKTDRVVRSHDFTLPSCNYGKDCWWTLDGDVLYDIDSSLRNLIVRTYQNANTALPKIRELVASQYYDNVDSLESEFRLISTEQAAEYSRDQFKKGINVTSVSISVMEGNEMLVNYKLSSDIVSSKGNYLILKEIPNGIVRSQDEAEIRYCPPGRR